MNAQTLMRRINLSNNIQIYVHLTPGDGNCMLHAIANATHVSYDTGIRNSRPVSKSDIVRKMREEILQRLFEINKTSGKTNYETISGGYFAESSRWIKSRSKERIRELFSGSGSLGEEAKVIIEFFVDKNLLIINAENNKIYTKDGYDPGRYSIILYYTSDGDKGHFEMVSMLDNKDRHVKLFHPSSRLVRHLIGI